MLNATRNKYDAYTQQVGKMNNVADPSRSFEVLPAIAQTLRAKLKGSSDFLSKINIIPVVAQEGDKVGVGLKGMIARRSTPGRTSPISRHCLATRSSAPRSARAMQTRLLQSRDRSVDRSHDRQRGRPVHRGGRSAHAFRHRRRQAFG